MPTNAAPPWSAPVEDRRLRIAGLGLLVCGAVVALWLADRISGRWPLPTSQFVGFALGALLVVNVLVAGLLVLSAGCAETHGWRNPGRRRAVALQILLANLLAPALLYGLITDDAAIAAKFEAQGVDAVASLVIYALIIVAWRLWRCSRRYDAVGADEAMALDPRPPVLYLRSFHDDDRMLIDDGGCTLQNHLMSAITPLSPEQEIAEILARLGPVVAIGKPGEPLPQLGAARLYVAQEAWQAKVTELMAVASLVVVRVGSSPGVLWEIEQALAHVSRQRLVLAILGGSAIAPALVARLVPVLGPSFAACLPQPAPRGFWSLLFRARPNRRIGGFVCFDDSGAARTVPVRTLNGSLADALYVATLRPSAGPLRRAWRDIFTDLGLAGAVVSKPRSRFVAILLAVVAGWTGAQWFYLGRHRRGWVYLATFPLLMASYFLSLADAVRFVWVDRREFDARFVGPVGARARVTWSSRRGAATRS